MESRFTYVLLQDLKVGSVVFSLSKTVRDNDVMSDSSKKFQLYPYMIAEVSDAG